MDYDDNDFHSQNFDLKTEESNKFPPILRPFCLPKFEIEDHLSLTEPENLFTIPSLSHSTNWIHDFSPQNSTIESCSISRTKNNPANVWSEATSTESVEMMLKSVTEQDEIAHNNDDNNNNNNTNMDGHVHDMDYSHMMDMDPSSSMLGVEPSDDKSKSNVLEECITTEQDPLEDSKFSRSSDGLLESITYPIRNYGLGNQFENVSYPQIRKELPDKVVNIGDVSEKIQVNTAQESGSVEVPKKMEPKDLSVEDTASPLTGTGTDAGTERNSAEENVDSELKSQSTDLAPSEEGDLLTSDITKNQASTDDIGGEPIQPVLVPASNKPCENTELKEKESSSSEPLEKDIASVAVLDAPSPKEPVIDTSSEPGTDKQEETQKSIPSKEETPPPPPPATCEANPNTNVTESNISPVEKEMETPVSTPISETGKENPSPTMPELTCGSPTTISCSPSCLEEEAKQNSQSNLLNDDKSEGENNNKDDKSFSFNVVVANVPERETAPDWKPFPSLKPPMSPPKEPRPTTPSPEKPESKEITKMPSKETKPKAETTAEPSPKKRRERKKNTPSASASASGTSLSPMHLEAMKKYPGLQEGGSSSGSSSSAKTRTPNSGSGLPDLNASVSSASLAHQPFTDSQHVQLRAQIIVYGSLIQGKSPAEAFMVSAFGDSEGGRAKWKGPWRTALEKNQNQVSPSNALETPTSSRSAQRMIEGGTKESSAKKKSPSSRAGTKSQGVSTVPHVPTMTPPSIPTVLPRGTQLDFTQSVPPISPMYHPYQQMQMKNQSVPQNIAPWLSPAQHSSPWVIKTGTPVSTVPTTTITTVEPAKITPRRRTPPSSPVSFPPVSSASASVPVSPTSSLPVPTETQKAVPVPPPQDVTTPPTQKTRKRKKASTTPPVKEPENHSQLSPPLLPSSSPPIATPSPSISPSPLPPQVFSPPKIIFAGQLAAGTSLVTSSVPSVPSNHQLTGGSMSNFPPIEHNKSLAIFSEDVNTRIQQSKLHADEAATHAAAAVKYSQGVWSQLASHKSSSLTSDAEQRLTSAAAAVSAAASVAKAAALSAKLASEAALQAKIMAEEAMKMGQSGPGSGQASGQPSFIAFARETAKKRVEEASAAAKRAQNFDAVIKAAEVAAQAVSQAGVVVAMGDPLPLGIQEMLEKGPDGFWKGYFGNSDKDKTAIVPLQLDLTEKDERSPLPVQRTELGDNSGDASKASNKDKGVAVEQPTEAENINGIQKGSLIEVLADEAGLRGVWFAANVLDVEDNRLLVCYTDRFADEGLGQLKEWIAVKSDSDGAPGVRKAHPMMAGVKPEGTRKRRRDAVGSSFWSVGDLVDAWIRDGWRQGTITEKSDGDTKFTVQFLGAGGSSTVEAWNLRPSLIWKDGQWSLWTRTVAKKTQPKEGESPYEKRQRIGHLASDTNQTTNAESSNINLRPFNLPTIEEDEGFNVGKFTMGETTATITTKTSRRTGTGAGTQKEGGSKVVFGVPKPGKKRKFMDVSKHFGGQSDKDENPNPNPSVKVANYLMPQNRAPKTKGKEIAEPKPRTGLKSMRSQQQNGSQSNSDSLAEQLAPLSSLVGAVKEKKKSEHKRKNVSVEVEVEEEKNVNSDSNSNEPRRSNRRIQPTSRLLEGLQSSLMIAKIPSDKSVRGTPKGASSSAKGRP